MLTVAAAAAAAIAGVLLPKLRLVLPPSVVPMQSGALSLSLVFLPFCLHSIPSPDLALIDVSVDRMCVV